MSHDPELDRLANIVIDGLTVIHGWAELALLEPQNPHLQEQALRVIQCTARQVARRLQDHLRSRETGSGPE